MTKQEILEYFKDINHAYNESTRLDDLSHMLDELMQSNSDGDKGEISDGYHTFNQLYHQRAVLFATIVNQNQDKAWKSFKHSDGQYCFDSNGEWFIVGVDTPDGSYTYHYAKEYWDMFHCKELECGKEWDGHTEEDVTRLLTLESNSDEDRISREWVLEHQRIVVDDDGIMLPVVDVSIVKKAPSIQPKPKYVAVGNVNFDKDEFQKIVDEAILTIMPEIEYRKAHWQNNACSNCGIYNASAYKNWCPNCGCQMTEEIE